MNIYQKYTKVLLHFVAGQLLLCGKVMHYASWLGSVAAGCNKKRKKAVGKCWQTNATRTNAAVNLDLEGCFNLAVGACIFAILQKGL